MKNSFRSLALLPLLGLVAAASTLSVVSSETKVAGLYDYSYSFSVSGAGHGFDNIFLGSNDLSPLNLVIQLNGTATVDWSYLGNDTPENYVQFFSESSTALVAGETLHVTFASTFAPAATEFAVALNSATNQASNQVNNVTAPGAVPTPEPSSSGLLLISLFVVAAVLSVRRRRGLMRSASMSLCSEMFR